MNLGEGEKPNPTNRGEGEPLALGVYADPFKWERTSQLSLAAGKDRPCTSMGKLSLGQPALSAGLSWSLVRLATLVKELKQPVNVVLWG